MSPDTPEDEADADAGSNPNRDPDPAPDAPEAVERLAAELRERGEPFVRATVVRREPPVSASVGDAAVVTADGDLRGWVGGTACAQSVVTREAEAALAAGEPKLVGLAPDPAAVDRPGLEAHRMTCHSGGTLEVFLEPVLPGPALVVAGETPVARALRRRARDCGFRVVAAGHDGAGDDPGFATVAPEAAAVRDAAAGEAYVVAASMGEYDAPVVTGGLAAGARYVGLIASDRRADAVARSAADRLGVEAPEVRAALAAPAGLEIGAAAPAEIAVSVLAELVAVRRGGDAAARGRSGVLDALPAALDVDSTPDPLDDESTRDAPAGGAAGDGKPGADAAGATARGSGPAGAGGTAPDGDGGAAAVDPVCGMAVDPAEAAATVEHGGETYHFCSAACADGFERAPAQHTGE